MGGRTDMGVFPFMNLPAELRNAIYDVSLHRPLEARRDREDRMRITTAWGYNDEALKIDTNDLDESGDPACLPLLATTRAIQAEATALIYQHSFLFHTNHELVLFLTQIGGSRKYLPSAEVIDWELWGNVGFDSDPNLDPCVVVDLQALTCRTVHTLCQGALNPKLVVWTDYEQQARSFLSRTLKAYRHAADVAKHKSTEVALLELLEQGKQAVEDWEKAIPQERETLQSYFQPRRVCSS